MTSRYLEQLNTIKTNDTVSMWILIAAMMIVLTMVLSRYVQIPKLRLAVQVTTGAVCFVTYFALLIAPMIGAL